MDREELEHRIQHSKSSGIFYSTDSDEYEGEIFVGKRAHPALTLEDVDLVKPGTDVHKLLSDLSRNYPKTYKGMLEERQDAKERPISVFFAETRRSVVEEQCDPEPEDFRKKQLYYVRSIEEAEAILRSLGFSIADLKPMG